MKAIAAVAWMVAFAVAGCATPEDGAGPAASAPRAAAGDSLSALDPFLSYRRAIALGEQQRFTESLPYFRRALAVPTDAWQPHCDYAISLFHAALEPRTQRGLPRPAARSSRERLALLLESGRQLDEAERLARTPADRAFVIARRARHLAAWQLTWNAVSEYARAAALAPAQDERARALIAEMRDPLHAAPPAP